MKNLIKISILSTLLIFAVACVNSNSPEAVAQKFLKHINKKEYKEAIKLCTERSIVAVDQMESFDKFLEDNEKPKKESKIENIKCKVEGETASCTYLKDGKENIIILIKENSKWLVDEYDNNIAIGDSVSKYPDDIVVDDSTAQN
jgi:hypothetical protein